jgi:hypothetical protein
MNNSRYNQNNVDTDFSKGRLPLNAKKGITQLIVGVGLIVCLISHTVQADNWQPNPQHLYSVIEFKNTLFAFVYPTLFPNHVGIKKSTNGVDWESVTLPAEDIGTKHFVYFRVHKETLYLFVSVSWGEKAHIYRTTDGQTIEMVREDIITSHSGRAYPSALSSLDGHLYVVLKNGEVIRTTGEGPSLTWVTETIGYPPDQEVGSTGPFLSSMADLHGIPYVAVKLRDNFDSPYYVRIFKKTDHQGWQQVGLLSPEDTGTSENIKLFSTSQKLYLTSGLALWEIDIQKNPAEWDKQSYPQSKVHTSYVLEDNVYIWEHMTKVRKLNQNGVWEFASENETGSSDCSPNYERFNEKPVVLNNKAWIVSNCFDLWTLQLGVEDVISWTVPGQELFQGQSNAPILEFDIKSNLQDAINLTVQNIGTATSAGDIESVRLARLVSNREEEFILDYLQDLLPVNDRSWRLSSFEPVNDGDQLYLTVDISPTATPGRTVRFLIESESEDRMRFETNTEFRLPGAILSSQFKEIKPALAGAGALAALQEVIVFPQPAKDIVRFNYYLSDPSDVKIKIYDREGGLVKEVNDPGKPAGNPAQTTWNASHIAPGIYYATVQIKPIIGEDRFFKRKIAIER